MGEISQEGLAELQRNGWSYPTVSGEIEELTTMMNTNLAEVAELVGGEAITTK